MKKFILSVLALTLVGLTAIPSTGQARVFVNVRIGLPFFGCGYYSAPYYVTPTYVSPVVYTQPAQVVVQQPAPVVVQTTDSTASNNSNDSLPAGVLQADGTVKSPFSAFVVPVSGRSSGEVVYDANNGKAFRIP